MKLIEKQVIKSGINVTKLGGFKENPAKRLYERFNYKVKNPVCLFCA